MPSMSSLLTKRLPGSATSPANIWRLHRACARTSSTAFFGYRKPAKAGSCAFGGVTSAIPSQDGFLRPLALGSRSIVTASSTLPSHSTTLNPIVIAFISESNQSLYSTNFGSLRWNSKYKPSPGFRLHHAIQARSIFFLHFRSTSRSKSTGAGRGSDSTANDNDFSSSQANDPQHRETGKKEDWVRDRYGEYNFNDFKDFEKMDQEFLRAVKKRWEEGMRDLDDAAEKYARNINMDTSAFGSANEKKKGDLDSGRLGWSAIPDFQKVKVSEEKLENQNLREEEEEIDPITLRWVKRRRTDDAIETKEAGMKAAARDTPIILSPPPASSALPSDPNGNVKVNQKHEFEPSASQDTDVKPNYINYEYPYNFQAPDLHRSHTLPDIASPSTESSTQAREGLSGDSSLDNWAYKDRAVPHNPLSTFKTKDVEKRLEKGNERLEKLSKEFEKIQEKIREKNDEWLEKQRPDNERLYELERWATQEKEEQQRKYRQEMMKALEREREVEEIVNKRENKSIPHPVPVLHPYQIPKKEKLSVEQGNNKENLLTGQGQEHGKAKDTPGLKRLSKAPVGLEVEPGVTQKLGQGLDDAAIVPPKVPEPTEVREEVNSVLKDIESAHEVAAGVPPEEPIPDSGDNLDASLRTSRDNSLVPKKSTSLHQLNSPSPANPNVLAEPLSGDFPKGLVLEAQSSSPPVLALTPELESKITRLPIVPTEIPQKTDTQSEPEVSAELKNLLEQLKELIETLKPGVQEKREEQKSTHTIDAEAKPVTMEDYKILTISASPPYRILTTEIEGNLSLPSPYAAKSGTSVAEFLPKLKSPYLFLQHLPQLQSENWDLVAGGEEMLVFVRRRASAPAAAGETSPGEEEKSSPEMKEIFTSSSTGYNNIQTGHGVLKDTSKSHTTDSATGNRQFLYSSIEHPWNYGGMSIGGIAGDFGSFGNLPSTYQYNYLGNAVNPIDMTRDEILSESQDEVEKELQKVWDGKREDAVRSMKEGKMKAQKEVEMREKQAEKENEKGIEENQEVDAEKEPSEALAAAGNHTYLKDSSPPKTVGSPILEEETEQHKFASGTSTTNLSTSLPAKKRPGMLKRFFRRLGWAILYVGGGIFLIKEVGFYLNKEEMQKEKIMDGTGSASAGLTGTPSERERERRVQERVVPMPVGRRIGRVRVVDDAIDEKDIR